MTDLSLVLASGSPRRRRMLHQLGLTFAVRPVDLDETRNRGEAAVAYVRRLALAKGKATRAAGEAVVAADTVVVLDEEILGKPRDRQESRSMLQLLSGRRHRVLTGTALCLGGPGGEAHCTVTETEVQMATLEREEIAWYVGTGETDDKAGAYAIQGVGALFVEAIRGSYSNVVGLPLAELYALFREAGLDLRAFRQEDPG